MNDNEAAARVKTQAASPLWMPHGSVRAVLAVGLVVSSVILHVIALPSDTIDTLAITAVSFYFGSKNGHPK
ncbi:MAG: hypothetical protein ACTSX8_11010 [Alphaproteobacteria bacterium]